MIGIKSSVNKDYILQFVLNSRIVNIQHWQDVLFLAGDVSLDELLNFFYDN